LKWVNMSDLFRVKGIGPETSELWKKEGVDTMEELKTARFRTPEKNIQNEFQKPDPGVILNLSARLNRKEGTPLH
jgi:hypothetical protein